MIANLNVTYTAFIALRGIHIEIYKASYCETQDLFSKLQCNNISENIFSGLLKLYM